MESSEKGFSPEQQEMVKNPTVRLEIFRHDQPAPAPEGGTDADRQLTSEGRVHAEQSGQTKNPNMKMGIAIGSPRDRAQETALRQLISEDILGSGADFSELKSVIDHNLNYGNKIRVTEKLDYRLDSNPEFQAAWFKSYNEKHAMKFLLEESDKLAADLKDAQDFSYSRSAANVAEVIKGYVLAAPSWKRTYDKDPSKYKANEMQRFMGTHQTIGETFLLKVVEKTQGTDAASALAEKMGNGFDLSEGFSVVIDTVDQSMSITYKDKSWKVNMDVLDQIIKDKTDLDNSIK